jgi:heat shock protein HslJ
VLARAAGLGLAVATLTGCMHMTTSVQPQPTGTVWLVEDVGGGGIIDSSHITLFLDGKGRANGSGGCNRYMGRYHLSEDQLSFDQIAGTRMACAPSLMLQEQRFLKALAEISTWRIEPTGALVLTGYGGASLRLFPEEPAHTK